MDYLLIYVENRPREWESKKWVSEIWSAFNTDGEPLDWNSLDWDSQERIRDSRERIMVKCENYENFEEMMIRFTLMSYLKEMVLVVEKNTKKVVCWHEKGGHTTFNRYLLDTMFFDNFDKESLKLQPGND